MRQLFLEKGTLVVKEVSQPLLDDYSVLVSVQYSFMGQGNDDNFTYEHENLLSSIPSKVKKIIESVTSHGIEGTKALIKGKLLGSSKSIGYSVSGRIIAVGSKVKKFHSGDLVACAGIGLANHADIVCVPEHLVVQVHAQEHLKAASLTTIGAIALQGIRRAAPALGETICVVGLGLVGQMVVQLAKLSGCKVIGIDPIAHRLELAKKIGADFVYDFSNEQLKKEIDFLTGHHGLDITLITDAFGDDKCLQQVIDITRKKGKIVLVGAIDFRIAQSQLHKKEIDVLISTPYILSRYEYTPEHYGSDYSYAHIRWTEQRNMQTFVQLIEEGKLSVTELELQEIELDSIADAYEQLKHTDSLGMILKYGIAQPQPPIEVAPNILPEEHENIRFVPARADKLRVGLIGAGMFAKVKLLPIISKLPDVTISAVVDADIGNSLNVTKQYGAARALVGDQDLFKEDLVDVVFIASPHKFHCEQALHALQNGKAVFAESPMVTDFAQFTRLKNFLISHPQVPFCIDYNRSFAPYMQKIKQAIIKRNSPLVIHYRVNSGFVLKDHWMQSDVGAGRIIGQSSHIIDLFCFLTESKPMAVSVEAVHVDADDIFPTDNFSAQISFEDGSICSLLYTALGNNQLGKERMELFFDSKTIVMDDYAQLHGFGFPSTFHETTMSPNRGHEELITIFFNRIKQPPFESPISLERLNMVTELTLIIDALACEGGGKKELSS